MTGNITRLPVTMKRGRKTTTGPKGDLIEFPNSLVGDALLARWAWLCLNRNDWETEESDGALSEKETRDLPGCVTASGRTQKTRSQVREWSAQIEKRARVKDWLESIGIDWNKTKDAESALFFVFDQFTDQQGVPPAA